MYIGLSINCTDQSQRIAVVAFLAFFPSWLFNSEPEAANRIIMVVKKHDGGFLGILWGTWDDFWQVK